MNFFEWFFLNKERAVDGMFSRAHLFTVTFILVHLVAIALYLGFKYKNNPKAISTVLKVSAFIMIFLYIAELTDGFVGQFVEKGLRLDSQEGWLKFLGSIVNCVPLYLCDIAIFAIPIIAFSKGKIKTVLSDFLAIWGIPMGVIGTYLAGNVFAVKPVFSFDGFLCIFIHVVPAAVTVFLYATGLASLKRENVWRVLVFFFGFSTFTLIYDYIFNGLFDTNFMFFFKGDGTPFDMFRPYVPLPVYQIIVFSLYAAYILAFYGVFFLIKNKIDKKKANKKFELENQN